MVDRLRCLIAGCGDVGTRLGLLLAADGHEVVGLRRGVQELPAGLRAISADLETRRGFELLPRDVDLLFVTMSAGRRSDEAGYRATYVDGPQRLLDALAAVGPFAPRRVLFTSSTSVYGQTGGSEVDEDSPTEPVDFRGRVMLEAEQRLLERPWPTTVLRLGGIYGPGRTWLLDAVRDGHVGLDPDGRSAWTNRIHADDAARALAHLAGLGSAATHYVGVDTEPARLDDVVRWLAARIGVEPRPVAGGARARGGDRRCSSARLVRAGFAFRYPTFREGYAELLDG